MSTRHKISSAGDLYHGNVREPTLYGHPDRAGIRWHPVSYFSLGSPAVADVDLIVDAATSTELPNNETVTYTTADDGSSPFDNTPTPAPADVVMADGATYSVWTLDAPRCLQTQTTHSSSIVAMTVTIHGFDVYGHPMSETITVAATGTDETDTGVKAFKYIYKIVITSGGDAESNTLNLGSTDALGLPYVAGSKAKVLGFFDGLSEISVITLGVTTDPATATTGDPRGTLDAAGTLNGSKLVEGWMMVDGTSRATALGVDHYYDPTAFV